MATLVSHFPVLVIWENKRYPAAVCMHLLYTHNIVLIVYCVIMQYVKCYDMIIKIF